MEAGTGNYLCRMRQADYLIIGQGIAGSVLAWTLLKRGRSVVVIDQPSLSSSSRVAAGAFNPFNFRRMINNWRAETLVPFTKTFYEDAERQLGRRLYYSRRVLKVFTSEDERRLWEKACREDSALFADPVLPQNPFPSIIDTPFGMGAVNGAGNIDTGMLLYAVSERLQESGALLHEIFDEGRLALTSDGVRYDNRIAARQLVLCEGHLTRNSSYFGWLPLRPVKGQLLHVHIPGLALTDILNRGVYLLPQGNELFIAGATFENDRDDETATAAAAEELLGKLGKFIRVPVRVESRYAGVRPAVKDRRPLLGRHPQHPQLAVFNGLGSKGVFLAPWLSEQLADFLENRAVLPAEVNIERFRK